MLDQSDELHLFALHYVFLPRINNLLSRWSDAYNRHPLATEHNSSPRQLWVESMLHLQNSDHAAPEGVFNRDVVGGTLEQYGVDWEGPCPDNEPDVESVTVPPIHLNLPPRTLQNLQETVNPLAHSELFGTTP